MLIFAYCTPHSQNRPSRVASDTLHVVMKKRIPQSQNNFICLHCDRNELIPQSQNNFICLHCNRNEFIEGFFSQQIHEMETAAIVFYALSC